MTEQSFYQSRTACAQGPFVLDIPVGAAKWGEAIELSVRTPRRIAIHATITAGNTELASIDDTFDASGRVGGNADNARCVADARERLAAERARRAGTQPPTTTSVEHGLVTTPNAQGSPPAPSAPPPATSVTAELEVVPSGIALGRGAGLSIGVQTGMAVAVTPGTSTEVVSEQAVGLVPVVSAKIPEGVTSIRVTWWSVLPNDLEGAAFGLSHVVWKPDIGEERYEAYLAEKEAKRIAEEKRVAELHEAWLRDEEERKKARAAKAAEEEARHAAEIAKRRAEADARIRADFERREAERQKQRAETDAKARADFHLYFECRQTNPAASCSGASGSASIGASGSASIRTTASITADGPGAPSGAGGGVGGRVGGGGAVGGGVVVRVETEEQRRLRIEAELRIRREAEARRVKLEADARLRAEAELRASREAEARRVRAEAELRIRAEAEEQRRLKVEAETRIVMEKRRQAEEAAAEKRRLKIEAELRAAEERKQFCATHGDDRSCWGPGGLDMKLQLDARADQAKTYCAQHHEDARCWTADDRARIAAADQARMDIALTPPSKPNGPPPAALAETMPPRLSVNATWRPGYWHWVDSTWVWLAGMWRVPEADVVAEQTTTAPIAPPALQIEAPSAPPVASAVWTAGFWQWDGAKYVWIAGSWQLRPSSTVTWRATTWQPRGNVHVLVPGAWIRIGGSR
ncbi:MAG TPA: hypothetical protein VL326_36600 [Kofleriaceae bacterium]|nr:hypothetical protein [Kofleriaceae bacterium]